MRTIDRIIEHILQNKVSCARRKKMRISLASVVVFVMTYILVLPALTIDDSTVQDMPGIDAGQKTEQSASDTDAMDEQSENKNGDTGNEIEKSAMSASPPANSPEKGQTSGKDRKSDNSSLKDLVNEDGKLNKAGKEEKMLQKKTQLTYKGDGYRIIAECSKETKLPADVNLKIKEIRADSNKADEKAESAAYSERSLGIVRENDGKDKDGYNRGVRLFDISFVSGSIGGSGEDSAKDEIDPAVPVEIRIEFDNDNMIRNAGRVRAVSMDDGPAENGAIAVAAAEGRSFDSKSISAELLDTKTAAPDSDKDTVSDVSFKAEKSRIYGTVFEQKKEQKKASKDEGSGNIEGIQDKGDAANNADEDGTDQIRKTVISAGGTAYEVTVTYGEDAGVPEGSGLDVSEITKTQKGYSEYVLKSEAALGIDAGTASYVRLFDIRIVDPEGKKADIAAPVDVKIELADKKSSSVSEDTAKVVHFADSKSNPEVVAGLETETKDKAVTISFETEGFSVYAIVDAPEPEEHVIKTVSGLDELASAASDPAGEEGEEMYFSLTRAQAETEYYFKNSLKSGGCFEVVKDTPLAADTWYLEKAGNNEYRIYTYVDGSKMYVKHSTAQNANGLDLVSNGGSIFEVSADNGRFLFKLKGQDKWLQYSNGGGGIRLYNENTNVGNTRVLITYASSFKMRKDPYELDGLSFGIAFHDDRATSAALTDEEKTVSGSARLKGQDMLMRPDVIDNSGILLVAKGADITEWTFESVEEDKYYITTTVDGQKKYLSIDRANVRLTDDPDPVKSLIKAVPGTGAYSGKYNFMVNGYALEFSGKSSDGFRGSSSGSSNTWLNLVKKTDLGDDDFNLYNAKKVSVSDENNVYDKVVEGERKQSQVIIYTRVWNDTKKRYEFFAVDYNGTLIPCYDTGDKIEWIGSTVNTALWEFTEYHNSDGTPNYYYELQNVQHGNYIAPQVSDGQVMSREKIGINLFGRKNGEAFTKIIAWDDDHYSYAGLKTENGKVVSCPISEAEDFYFAVIDPVEEPQTDKLSTVNTLQNDQHGITMKMMDFNEVLSSINRAKAQYDYFGKDGGKGMLSTDLKDDGYPAGTSLTSSEGVSFGTLFNDLKPVDHLFLESIYNESGYYEYDSTQNFAHLNANGNFTVYDQIAGMSGGDEYKDTRTHGQFMPYNNVIEGDFLKDKNGKIITNQTDVLGKELSDTDPRKGEKLYNLGSIKTVDYFFGMEMEAGFTQTASGLDAWGHDIIFEFSGDDDFWLYVDNELVLDLGGVHRAQVGSINFRTGVVTFSQNDTVISTTTLYDVFKKNYQARGMSNEQIQQKLGEKFHQNEDGQYVFTDYSNHKMKMLYMERGAGSSNLHMRFNLAAVKPGTFVLSKKLSGTDDPTNDLIEFPYQIYYTLKDEGGTVWHRLGENEGEADKVKYKGRETKVKYKESFTPAGGSKAYSNVFFLKPGESAEVEMPEGVDKYKVVECGVNPDVYDNVKANDEKCESAETLNYVGDTARRNYSTDEDTLGDRPQVDFDNHVREGAMRSLNITKKLYDSDGQTILNSDQDPTPFKFRVYLGNENADPDSLPLANLYHYYVKDGEGNYCKYVEGTGFVSLGKTEFSDLTEADKAVARFTSSMTGTISKIPADHTVELRGLIAGTMFKVEERDEEIPKGYTLRLRDGYTRIDEGKEGSGEHGTIPISGTVRAGYDPHIQVRNQKGWGLTIDKNWTDSDFMESHDPIYFAVFVKKGSGSKDRYEMLPGTLRQMRSPNKSLYYFFGNLQSGTPFEDYTVFEVNVNGDINVDADGFVTAADGSDIVDVSGQGSGGGSGSGTVTVERIEEGDTLSVGGTPVGGSHSPSFDYKVSYKKGEQTTQNENVRTDEVTNSRPGIEFIKTDMGSGQQATQLSGAVFTLKDSEGHDVAAKEYTSGTNGLITIAYLEAGTYTLTEKEAPEGYMTLTAPITFTLGEDGNVTAEGPEGMYEVVKNTGSGSGGSMVATIIVKDRPSALQVRKTDEESPGTVMLKGAHFAVYRQVKDINGNKVKASLPIEGYEDVVSDENGILPDVTMKLGAGTFYLTETSAPTGYELLGKDLIFTIKNNGTVKIESEGHSGWLTEDTDASTGMRSYMITIPDEKLKARVSVWKTNEDHDTIKGGAGFALYKASDYNDAAGAPKEGAVPVSSGITGTNGILYLGKLNKGEYRLVETKAPAGYNIEGSPIPIIISEGTGPDSVSAMQSGSPCEITKKGDQYWVAGQNDKTLQIRVWNNPGAELPSTGGTGTTWMYLVGVILTLTAGAVLLTRRRAASY